MGNQNSQNVRRISTESAPGGSSNLNSSGGISVSAEPSPKRPHRPVANAKQEQDGSQRELQSRIRRHSDASKDPSRSPSPTRGRAKTVSVNSGVTNALVRNRRHAHHGNHGSIDATNTKQPSSGQPRTPRLAFKKFQVIAQHRQDCPGRVANLGSPNCPLFF